MTYNALIVHTDEAWEVSVPDIPGCFTYGSTLEEAKAMAKEAIEGMLLGFADRGQPLPQPRFKSLVDTYPIDVEMPQAQEHPRSA
ncbi:MAG TPA: type II toxin-antitoxin system HicB family antitoxin [Fimbriimonadaceae bacterium]|jgi:predicted RNase H-like HicB family nuclease